MKTKILGGILSVVALFFMLTASVNAQPATTWNMLGTISGGFEVQDGNYSFTLLVSSEDQYKGTFSGTFNNGAISGTISGNSFQFSVPGLGGYGGGFTGTIAPSGIPSGTMFYTTTGGVWNGFWYTTSGMFVQSTGLVLSPSQVYGSNSATGTVSLTQLAKKDLTVKLNCSNPAATVPSQATIKAGTAYCQFTITTRDVGTVTSGNISATYSGVTNTASFTVLPDALATLTLASPNVAGGSATTMQLSLAFPAGGSGITATFTSSDPSVAVTQGSILIPPGQSTATVTILTSSPITVETLVTFRATVAGKNLKVVLTVTP